MLYQITVTSSCLRWPSSMGSRESGNDGGKFDVWHIRMEVLVVWVQDYWNLVEPCVKGGASTMSISHRQHIFDSNCSDLRGNQQPAAFQEGLRKRE